jgi:ABC-type antimicrobial peptide transport system permease subunit
MVAKWGLRLTLSGVAIGMGASFGLAYVLQRLVFGVGAYDPLSFAGGTLLLGAAALLACYVPVRQALNMDPVTTLRTE